MPKLIEYFISYLKAGIQVPYCLNLILNKYKWSPPIQKTIYQIITFYNQGMSLDSAVKARIISLGNHKDHYFMVYFLTSLRVGYKSGGNMISTLENVKSKIESNILLKRKIKSTTAQIRLQALIIAMAPLILGIILWFIVPSYILFFFENAVGNLLLLMMIFLNMIGFYFLKMIARIA
ncbi:type II secretion system F family protein [Silvanigrella aquatica]|nr:type II secretion system F family protein [Silvanigrella aquatica]